ncbi:MAG: hypothetical protein HAW67_04360, partial [Endozoicomonadaceae bacterium]|nr:hypothetical protein [Endozoicomonadaceae bacterium]
MLVNNLKTLFFCLLAVFFQSAFAVEKDPGEEKKITQAIQTIGYFSQIAKSFKRQNNNESATDINQIYEHAAGILKGGAYLERQDPWGVPWIFSVKSGIFVVDSVNYKKYRDRRALITKNILKDPYSDTDFGEELVLTETLLASDEELDKPKARNRRRFEQYDCEGLLIQSNQISTDCRRIFFEKGAKFPEAISAETYYSGDDFVEEVNFLPIFSQRYSGDKYALDFSKNSDIQILNIASIEDNESTEFTLDANTLTILNFLAVESLKDISGSNLKDITANRVNNSEIVTLRTLPDLAVVRADILDGGSNIDLTIDGRQSNIGSVLVGTTDNQNYQSLRTIEGLSANAVQVGDVTSPLSVANNSLLVAGDIGVKGNIYTDNVIVVDNERLSLFADRVTHVDDINIQANGIGLVNNINNNAVNISTDNNADLNVTASQINFQTAANRADGYVFNDADANPILTIDTLNARVGIGATSTEALNVVGSTTVNSLAVDSPIRIRTTAKGKLLPLSIGAQDISWYGVDSITTLNNSAGTGSLAFESGNNNGDGRLYVQDNGTWQLLPLDQDSIHIGGDEFSGAATVGTNDNFDLSLITNNTTAFTLDTNQNASFFGNISLSNTNINNVNALQISTLSVQNNSLTFVLDDNQTNALRIQDSTIQYLNFDSTAKNINVGASLTLGDSLIVGDNFDINGGEIDGVSIGSNVPLTSLNVGNFTVNGNTIDTNNSNGIDFANNDISAGSFTFTANSNLDFTGGNLIDAGSISLDSLNPQTGSNLTINLNDAQTNALVIQQGANEYLRFDTSNNNIVASQNLILGANNISGSSFTITGGVIDNVVIGANTAASATFTSVAFDVLDSAVDFNNQILNNVNIDSGSIDGVSIGASTPLSALSVGSFAITGNTITSSTGGINFESNNLVTTGTFEGDIDLNGGDIVDVNNVSLNTVSARGDTLDIVLTDGQNQALIINESANDYLTFNTLNNQIILGQALDFNNNSASNIILTSGTIDNV